jgi:hypothetical protein
MAALEWKDDIVQLIPAIKKRLGSAGMLLDLSVSALSGVRGEGKVSTAEWLDSALTEWQGHVKEREAARLADEQADVHGLMLRTASGFVPPGRLLQLSYGSNEARSRSGAFQLEGMYGADEGGDKKDEGGGDREIEQEEVVSKKLLKNATRWAVDTGESDVPTVPFSVDRLISSAVTGVKELEGLVGDSASAPQSGDSKGLVPVKTGPMPTRPLHVTEVPANTQIGDVLRTLVLSRHMLSDHLILGTCHALEHALVQAQQKNGRGKRH